MAEVVSQRITNELTRLYAAVNEVANRAVVTSDDIQYFINCLEHFHRHLLRLSESGFVTAHSVSIPGTIYGQVFSVSFRVSRLQGLQGLQIRN